MGTALSLPNANRSKQPSVLGAGMGAGVRVGGQAGHPVLSSVVAGVKEMNKLERHRFA